MTYEMPPFVVLNGTLLRIVPDSDPVLLAGHLPEDLPGEVVFEGDLLLVCGFAYLYQPDHLLPMFAFDDFQREYHGAAALDFLVEKGGSYPRADVVGVRVSDNQRMEVFAKQLDIAGAQVVFACVQGEALTAVSMILLWDETWTEQVPGTTLPEDFPHWLARAVPVRMYGPACLPDLPEWINSALTP